jgi:hypothetical protein
MRRRAGPRPPGPGLQVSLGHLSSLLRRHAAAHRRRARVSGRRLRRPLSPLAAPARASAPAPGRPAGARAGSFGADALRPGHCRRAAATAIWQARWQPLRTSQALCGRAAFCHFVHAVRRVASLMRICKGAVCVFAYCETTT